MRRRLLSSRAPPFWRFLRQGLYAARANPAALASYELMRRSVGGAFGVSALAHSAVFVLVLYITTHIPDPGAFDAVSPAAIMWTPGTGPGGGSSGGGNRTPPPARPAEARRSGAAAPASAAPELVPPTLPQERTNTDLPGVISALPMPGSSLGPGSDGIAGRGRQGGVGDSVGPGARLGRDIGSGVDGYGPGDGGTTFPQLIREVPPTYTAGALAARIEGIVELRAVVRPDGSVGDVQVTRSLDRTFGLDDEAVRTVKQWRFRPGMRQGKPVAVVVPIEMRFSIR